jgi:hypothetical protein
MTLVFSETAGGTLDGVPFTADTLHITVNTGFPRPLDQYLVTGTSSTDPNLTTELTLDDFTGTALSSTQLPLTAPNLAAFMSADFAPFDGTADNPIEAEGSLTSLASAASASAPEPSSLILLAAGFASLARGFRSINPENRHAS